MLKDYELAQMNIARLLAPLDSPQLADFVDNLDRINTLAERSPGFLWRLQTEDGDATGFRPLDEDVLVNMSVWTDVQSLLAYVYQSDHVDFMRRRREWFALMKGEVYMVMWWVPAGHRPDIAEGIAKLDYLREHGPTAEAFTFKRPFAPPHAGAGEHRGYQVECPGA